MNHSLLHPAYDNLADIPTFPSADYKANVGWRFMDKFLADQMHIDTDPPYQRGYVWTQDQKERYIEYRLQGGMSGRILYWNCPNWRTVTGCTKWHDTLELVDGKQRLNAVYGFLNGTVRAFGKFLPEYADHPRLAGIRYDFEFHINNLTTQKEVVEWYLGLNNGGSIHTAEDLRVAYDILTNLNASK